MVPNKLVGGSFVIWGGKVCIVWSSPPVSFTGSGTDYLLKALWHCLSHCLQQQKQQQNVFKALPCLSVSCCLQTILTFKKTNVLKALPSLSCCLQTILTFQQQQKRAENVALLFMLFADYPTVSNVLKAFALSFTQLQTILTFPTCSQRLPCLLCSIALHCLSCCLQIILTFNKSLKKKKNCSTC